MPPLAGLFAAVPDPRQAQGKRHPLLPILMLLAVGTLVGKKGYCVMADWARECGPGLARALGFTRDQTPCARTLI